MIPDTGSSRRVTLVACFATIYLVWGSTYLMTKIGVRSLPPFLFGGVRFLLGGALLFAIASWRARRRHRRLPRPTPLEWRHLLIVGLCTVFISNSGNIWGLQYVPSNLAALLNVSSSFWIPILGLFGARAQAIGLRPGLGLAVGGIGTGLIAWPGAQASLHASHGVGAWPVIAILIGCIGWSAGTIYQRNARTTLDVLSFTALQMSCGGVMMLVVGMALGEWPRWHWDPVGIAALLYMMVFSSCIAYTAYAWLSVNATPAQVGTYGFVNPVIATGLGVWILDETLTRSQGLGALVILVGMLLVNWPDSARSAAPPAADRDPLH